MIFVTVGGQMPFDRLIRAVDQWAGARGRTDLFAQIGPADYEPAHMQAERFLDPPTYRRQMERADAVVAHAGMGTIITTLQLGKPLLVLPRLGELEETRNDHQVAAARHFAEKGMLLAAYDAEELIAKLDLVEQGPSGVRIAKQADERLLARLREIALS